MKPMPKDGGKKGGRKSKAKAETSAEEMPKEADADDGGIPEESDDGMTE